MNTHTPGMPSHQFTLTNWVHRQWLKRGWFAWLLLPVSKIVEILLALRRWYFTHAFQHRFITRLPVVVVGNLYAGGTGKTPALIGLVLALKLAGWRVGVVSRGYGVNLGQVPLVGQGRLAAEQFGDEPALIGQITQAPVAVHPNRERAANALIKTFPDINIIMCDDGLQHLALARDIEIIVQDARMTGNGWVQPAGPLRENAKRASFADAIIQNTTVNNDTSTQTDQTTQTCHPVRVRMTQCITQLRNLATSDRLTLTDFRHQHQGSDICAVAAIGQPEQFFKSLEIAGLILSRTIGLTDHTALTHQTITEITEPLILITAKDGIKCKDQSDPRIWVVEVQTRFEDTGFLDWFFERLEQIRRAKS